MAWARLDDGFHDHPKVDSVSLAAVGLYTLCLTWAHRHRRTAILPGHITEARVSKVAGRQARKLSSELVVAGLWETEQGLGGYVIHDFVDYLPKERDPEELAETGRKGAANRWQGHSKEDGNPDGNQDGKLPEGGMATDSSRASARAYPSRPVPDPSLPTTEPTVPTSAQTVIAEWIDRQTERPPARVTGQAAQIVGELLNEQFDPAVVSKALDEMTGKRLHPATLPSLVHGLVNGGQPTTPPSRNAGILDRAMARAVAAEQGQPQELT